MTPCGDKRDAGGYQRPGTTQTNATPANRQRNQKNTKTKTSDASRIWLHAIWPVRRSRNNADQNAVKQERSVINSDALVPTTRCQPQSATLARMRCVRPWASGGVRAIIDTFTHVCKKGPSQAKGLYCNFCRLRCNGGMARYRGNARQFRAMSPQRAGAALCSMKHCVAQFCAAHQSKSKERLRGCAGVPLEHHGQTNQGRSTGNTQPHS